MGFTHFLIDLSKTAVRKSDFKQIMTSYHTLKPLPEISRFNWKEGFFSPEKMEERRQMNERAQALRAEGSAQHGGRYNQPKSKKGGNNRKNYGKNRRG